MTRHTERLSLPYPEGGDPVVVHSDIEELAERVDYEIGTQLVNTNQRVSETEHTTGELVGRMNHTVTWEPTKNLFDPNDLNVMAEHTLSGFSPAPSEYYTLTGFIPVEPGVQYTMSNPRNWAMFDSDHRGITGTNGASSSSSTTTVTPPPQAAYLRASFFTGQYEHTFQVEQGDTATSYVSFARMVSGITLADHDDGAGVTEAPLRVTVDPNTLGVEIESSLGGKPIVVTGGPHLRAANGVYNIGSTWYDGLNWHIGSSPDEITPLRTEAGTVGANHGFSYFQNWVDHDKTTADLGSIWTDGVREWTLAAITDTGRAHFAPDPVIENTGEASITTSLAGDMVHVSGASNTATLPQSGANRGADQVSPAVTRHRLAYYVDGIRVTDGTRSGVEMEVRESYEIIDYRSLLAAARANPGEPYDDFDLAGTIRVRTTYTYTGGCSCVVHTELTELTPARLNQTGFVQAQALGGPTVHRTVPGVQGWDIPVDLASHTSNVVVAPDDLIQPDVPPVMSLDTNGEIAFALGYRPWSEGVASSPARIKADLIRYWDLRATKKSYPVAIISAPPGWNRIQATGYRVYLTPEDAAEVIQDAADAHAAYSALESFTSI